MNHKTFAKSLALIALIAKFAYGNVPPGRSFTVDTLPLDLIQLPAGFEIDLYYKGQLPGIRELVLGPSSSNQTIAFASSAAAGSITVLFDDNNDGTADRICTLYTNPGSLTNGMAYNESMDTLYVAQMQQIIMLSNAGAAAKADCDASNMQVTTLYQIPPPANGDAGHGRRSMALAPNGTLYVSIAGPGNIGECVPPLCTVYTIDTTQLPIATDSSTTTMPQPQLYAEGLRNTAGLTIDPRTGKAWAAIMSRDNLWMSTTTDDGVSFSDNAPDDLVYSFQSAGLDYQFPYCHWVGYGDPEDRSPGSGDVVVDDTMMPPGYEAPSTKTLSVWNESLSGYCIDNVPQKPAQALGPHVAPIGLGFYDIPSVAASDTSNSDAAGQNKWPTEWSDGGLYVAEHGSWNRRIAIGYRVAFLKTSPDGQVIEHTPFASGWLQGDGEGDQWQWGRPVGIMTLPDGSMLVSDDDSGLGGGAIYRIRYAGNGTDSGGSSGTPTSDSTVSTAAIKLRDLVAVFIFMVVAAVL